MRNDETRGENRVRFKIGEIEFETEGTAELVERERTVFLNTILPAAVEAIKHTRGTEHATQYIDEDIQTPALLSGEKFDEVEVSVITEIDGLDLFRTSLSSFLIKFGPLSDQDFVLVAAYYDEKKNGMVSFSSENVKKYYSEARRQKYSNYSELLKQLVVKGLIMDDPDAEQKTPKLYKLTGDGISYVESYKPKENKDEKPKVTRVRKQKAKKQSIYSSISADDLNLSNYPEIKAQDSFKKQMILMLYIVILEGKGETFSVYDIEYLMTDFLGLPSSINKINGVFRRNRLWFKSEQDEDNKKAFKYKLLQGAKDFAQSIIDGTVEE